MSYNPVNQNSTTISYAQALVLGMRPTGITLRQAEPSRVESLTDNSENTPIWARAVTVDGIQQEFIEVKLDGDERLYYQCQSFDGAPVSQNVSNCLYFTKHALEQMQDNDRQVNYDDIVRALGGDHFRSYEDRHVYISLDGLITIVTKPIRDVGHIVITTYKTHLSKEDRIKLTKNGTFLDPIAESHNYGTLFDLTQFYISIYNDLTEDITTRGQAAYNLAVLLELEGVNLNDPTYLEYLQFAILEAKHIGASSHFIEDLYDTLEIQQLIDFGDELQMQADRNVHVDNLKTRNSLSKYSLIKELHFEDTTISLAEETIEKILASSNPKALLGLLIKDGVCPAHSFTGEKKEKALEYLLTLPLKMRIRIYEGLYEQIEISVGANQPRPNLYANDPYCHPFVEYGRILKIPYVELYATWFSIEETCETNQNFEVFSEKILEYFNASLQFFNENAPSALPYRVVSVFQEAFLGESEGFFTEFGTHYPAVLIKMLSLIRTTSHLIQGELPTFFKQIIEKSLFGLASEYDASQSEDILKGITAALAISFSKNDLATFLKEVHSVFKEDKEAKLPASLRAWCSFLIGQYYLYVDRSTQGAQAFLAYAEKICPQAKVEKKRIYNKRTGKQQRLKETKYTQYEAKALKRAIARDLKVSSSQNVPR